MDGGITKEEGIGLIAAIAAHVAVIAALTLSPLGRSIEPPPQRMTVSFADTVADQSVSPKPEAQPAPDVAPDLGEQQQADRPLPKALAVPVPAPEPKPLPKPEPKPKPKPEPKPKPVPKPVAKPKPEPKPEPKPAPAKAKPQPTAKPAEKPPAKAEPKPATKPASGSPKAHPHPNAPAGGSKIGDDFLAGIPGVTSPGTDKVSPGDKAGQVSTASLRSAISRQIKPHWSAPAGVDTDKLVTVLSWTLNPDGSLAGPPVVVSQTGITDANRAQAQVYNEMAIRAVKLAAPFQLPPQAFAQWRRVSAFRFDRKLSQ